MHAHALPALRRQLRQQRRQIPIDLQQQSAAQAARFLVQDLIFIRSQHIAIYWPQDGELDPRPIAQHAWRLGKKIYLPILAPLHLNKLSFARLNPTTALSLNRFGILEPAHHVNRIPACQLDLIICPLLAFNSLGYRLGMGGGFYDRTLARIPRTRCYGLGYSWQHSDAFPIEQWDVPMKGIITENGIRCFQ